MAAISACSSDSSECGSSSSSVVSLLERLKSPIPADIGRARKLKTNPPPVGKRHCKGGVTSEYIADTNADFPPLDWWKQNGSALPCWADAAMKVLLLQPSSAAAERVFSISFGELQDNSLKDYIESSIMLQFLRY
jgi:hypothetical protein